MSSCPASEATEISHQMTSFRAVPMSQNETVGDTRHRNGARVCKLSLFNRLSPPFPIQIGNEAFALTKQLAFGFPGKDVSRG